MESHSKSRIRIEDNGNDLEKKLLNAIYQSNVTMATDCIKQGVDPNITDDDELTGLHHAAIRDDLPMARILCSSPKIDLNKTDRQMNTPLMYACTYRSVDMVNELLKKGANPNLINDKHQTALHMACSQCSIKMSFYLIRKGAEINVRDVFDNSPLSIAVIDHGSVSLSGFLLKKGANATKTKEFPLFLECVLNCHTDDRLKILKMLVKSDAEMIECLHPISKRNCLHYVGITGYLPAAKYLVKCNQDNLTKTDLTDRTPLDIAWTHQNLEVYEFFWRTMQKKPASVTFVEDVVEHVYCLFETGT